MKIVTTKVVTASVISHQVHAAGIGGNGGATTAPVFIKPPVAVVKPVAANQHYKLDGVDDHFDCSIPMGIGQILHFECSPAVAKEMEMISDTSDAHYIRMNADQTVYIAVGPAHFKTKAKLNLNQNNTVSMLMLSQGLDVTINGVTESSPQMYVMGGILGTIGGHTVAGAHYFQGVIHSVMVNDGAEYNYPMNDKTDIGKNIGHMSAAVLTPLNLNDEHWEDA